MLVIFDCLFFSEIFKRIKHFLSGKAKVDKTIFTFQFNSEYIKRFTAKSPSKKWTKMAIVSPYPTLNQIKRKKLKKNQR